MKLETIRSKLDDIVMTSGGLNNQEVVDRIMVLMGEIDIFLHEQDAPVAQPE